MIETETYTIDIPTESASITSISIQPQSPRLSRIDDIATVSDPSGSTSINGTTWSTESGDATETPNDATISTTSQHDLSSTDMTSSIWSTSSSATCPSSIESTASDASHTPMTEWIGVIIGSVCGFLLICLFILSIIFRDKSKTPSRDNQNNINIRLESGPFNRPLAETNPGCIPEGWDDIRG